MTKTIDIFKNKIPSENKKMLEERVKITIEDMPLAELRQTRRFTQQQIAKTLKINQASVSKMESQSDMYLSTIRKYIEALGGELEIVAKFPEGRIKVEKIESLNQ